MKKYLFLIAGLLAFAVSGQADAAVFKLGRNSGGTGPGPFIPQPGPHIGGNDIITCDPSDCKVGNSCLSMDEFKTSRCQINATVINTNGRCSCSIIGNNCSSRNSCKDTSSGACLSVTEWTEKCGAGKEGYRQDDGACGCRTPSDPNDSCPTGQYKHNGSCVSVCAAVTCREGYHTVVNGNSCCCQEDGNTPSEQEQCIASGKYWTNGSCKTCAEAIPNCTSCSQNGRNGAVICQACSGTLVPNSAGTACVAAGGGDEPGGDEPGGDTHGCLDGQAWHPVIGKCVYPMCILNCGLSCASEAQWPGYCPRCRTGYYMEYENGGCLSCDSAIPGCQTCSSANASSGSGSRTGVVVGETVITCSDCGAGNVYHPVLKRCVVANCPQHCAEGCQSNYCSRCEDNYQLNNQGGCDPVSGGGLQGGTPEYNAQD